MKGSAEQFNAEIATAEIDAMSRDVLLLMRTIGIYPEGHPQLVQMTERLMGWVKGEGDRGVTVGVTGTELVVDGLFCGGKESRSELLARLLHKRRVARLTFRPDLKPSELIQFARFLGDRELSGEGFEQALHGAGVEGVEIAPLDLGKLHAQMALEDSGDIAERDRRKDIWLWLQGETGSPHEMARALMGEALWEEVLGGDPDRVRQFADVLTRLGSMVDRALRLVPEENRKEISERLGSVGRTLGAEDLARLIDVYISDSTGTGEALDALLRHADGERMAALLAGLVSLGGAKEERLAAFLKGHASPETMLGMAGLVTKCKNSGEKLGFAAEVWEWLEGYLLDYDEEKYLGEGYRETLDRMAARLSTEGERGAGFGFFEEIESHLDRAYILCVREETEGSADRLNDRLTRRVSEQDGMGVLELIETVDACVPGALSGRRDLIEKIFHEVVPDIKDYPQEVRKRLIEFALRHESEVIEVALRALAAEERMLVRRFLVEMLCHFSAACVPVIVQRARSSVWYFVRNCAIILGRMRDVRAFPFLQALVNHETLQVRKEALRSLGYMGERGKRALQQVVAQPNRADVEREIARSVLERMRDA